jgi:NTE family protein
MTLILRHLLSGTGCELQYIVCCLVLLFMSGCASYGKIENLPVTESSGAQEYSLRSFTRADKNDDLDLLLTFSGGGTRAAAMAYGVMQELRDTTISINGETRRLLDEVDTISSVSGGSFTSAYYGLNGDGIFDTFEDTFLRFDLDKHLIYRLLNPVLWFSKKGRTDMAVDYFQKQVFHGATFADMMKPDMPLIVINASDLAYGVRFSFVQEYFDLLCSDLASFPVARAVAASSAVPVMFSPVVVQNHSGCHKDDTTWLANVNARAEDNEELATLTFGLETFADKEQREFIHFVDGGITDNTGLRAAYDIIELSGGSQRFLRKAQKSIPSHFVVIAVNASTDPVFDMDKSNKAPSIGTSMSAVTGVQLHRYNTATIDLLQKSMKTWAQDASTPNQPVTPYFIEVSFEDIKTPELRHFLNKIPTAFSLSDEQVDALIESGHDLLRNNPVFQQLLLDLKK